MHLQKQLPWNGRAHARTQNAPHLTPFYWRVWPYFSEGRAPTSHGQREVSQVRRWRLRWIRMRTGAMWSQDQKEHAGDGWRC